MLNRLASCRASLKPLHGTHGLLLRRPHDYKGALLEVNTFTSKCRASSSHAGGGVRPKGPPKPKGPKWFQDLRAGWKKIDEDPVKRKRVAMAVIGFYIVTGYFAFRYLEDTKYKATGEQNPYLRETATVGTNDGPRSIDGAVKAQDTTEIYDNMANEYDDKIWMEELTSYVWWIRRKLMKQAEGNVLEVSCGTGRNVKYFNPDRVSSVVFLDSSGPMLKVAQDKFSKRFPDYKNVQYVQGRAEDLAKIAAKSAQKFDTIYESFGLCSHEDPVAALKNFQELLAPGGKIVLLEHGRSASYRSINERMDQNAERRAKEWGCRWNLDIPDIINQSGLKVEKEATYHFGTTYFYILRAPQASSESA